MSTRRWAAGAAACLVLQTSALADELDLGVELSADEVAAADFVVMPDGEGLPQGGGNAVQGAEVYRSNCLACHGEGGAGGANDNLAGGHGTIDGAMPQKTVGSYWPYATTVFDYIRRAMPYQAPGSLSNDQVYAVTAYILFLNGIIAEADEMNRESLPVVRMPNRDNFVWVYEPQ